MPNPEEQSPAPSDAPEKDDPSPSERRSTSAHEAQPEPQHTPKSNPLERAFLIEAAKQGLVAPDDALALIGPLPDTPDESQADFIQRTFAELREQRPWLFARQSSPGLDQRTSEERDPSGPLFERAQSTGLTRDIQLWREAKRTRG